MTADLQPDLERIIRARDFSALRGKLENWEPADLASLIISLPVEDQVIVFRILPRGLAADVFEYLNLAAQELLLKTMAQNDVAALLNDMAPDDRTHLLDELPAAVTKQMLSLLTPEERIIAISLLGYPEDSIGRLMTPDYVSVRQNWTVEQVLAHIRSHGQDSETLSTIYVVDEEGVLIDCLGIRNILLASPATRVCDLMDLRVVALKSE
jgi:magnesium transporter